MVIAVSLFGLADGPYSGVRPPEVLSFGGSTCWVDVEAGIASGIAGPGENVAFAGVVGGVIGTFVLVLLPRVGLAGSAIVDESSYSGR